MENNERYFISIKKKKKKAQLLKIETKLNTTFLSC